MADGESQQPEVRVEELPGHGTAALSDIDQDWLLRSLEEISIHYRAAMRTRLDQWSDIHRAISLVPETQRAGEGPYASHLVSPLMRSMVRTAAARLIDGFLSLPEPWSMVEIWDDEAGSEEELESLKEDARAAESMLDGYSRFNMRSERWLPRLIAGATEFGDSVARLTPKRTTRRTRGRRGGPTEKATFRLELEEIANEDMTVWPLMSPDWEDLTVCGHTCRLTRAEFAELAEQLQLPRDLRDKVLAGKRAEVSKEARERLADEGMKIGSSDAGLPEIALHDWHINLPVTRDGRAEKRHVIWSEDLHLILWASEWRSWEDRHPYYRVPFGIPDAAWMDGLGHELRYAQAADSTLWNMLIDNLRVGGFNVLKVVDTSPAEAYMDRIAPGMVVKVDSKDDLTAESLGVELDGIVAARQEVQKDAMAAGGITFLMMGGGDPILKSGADPSSIQMLLTESARRIGLIDKGMRAAITEIQWGIFVMLQQYAPPEFYYQSMSAESADRLEQIRFQMPKVDLRRTFRLQVRAPGAMLNGELRKQQITILQASVDQHIKAIMEIGQVVWEQQPETLRRVLEGLLKVKHELFLENLRAHELPGVGVMAPKVEVTDQDQTIAMLQQTLQVLGQQVQQLQAQVQMAQAPPGQPPAQPPMMMGGQDAGLPPVA